MPLEVVCPSCQKRYRVPDKHAGKTTRCKHCNSQIPIPDAPAAPPAATRPPVARSKEAPPAAVGKPRRGRWWKILAINVAALGLLAGGLWYHFRSQTGEYTRLIADADAAAAAGDVPLACSRYDALFDRAAAEQVPRSVMPDLDAALQRWRDLVAGRINDADAKARSGDSPAAAMEYLEIQKLSTAGVVPDSATDQVAAALSRHRRLYLDLIDAARARQRDGDFQGASDRYRQLHRLAKSTALPVSVDASVRDALESDWPGLYRDQIRQARRRVAAGDRDGACKLFAALLAERGREVPSSAANDLKPALEEAVRTCGEPAPAK